MLEIRTALLLVLGVFALAFATVWVRDLARRRGEPAGPADEEAAAARVGWPTPLQAAIGLVTIESPCSLKEGLAAARKIARHFKWKGPIGLGFPGIIKDGHIGAVGNLGRVWEGKNGAALFRKATGCRVQLLNDADAAGLAEMAFGAGRGRKDTVILLTFGTGIGSGLFYGGQLFPNVELGHIPWRGKPFERYAAAAVRKRARLEWSEWAVRVNVYLSVVERLFSPDLIIIGGGVSKKSDKFLRFIRAHARVVPARLNNDAGIVGAALAWQQGQH